MGDWRSREVEREIHRRERNEWIEGATDSFSEPAPLAVYVCECGDSDCRESVRLTRPEYESVRSDAKRFVIALNHEDPEIERLISENERFGVVLKLTRAGRMSQEANPRSEGSVRGLLR